MPTALVSTEIVVGTLLLVIAVVLATTFLRRRYIARGLPLTLCGLREAPGRRWRLGHIRFGENALEWYSLGGVSLRPRHRWDRQSLMLNVPLPLADGDSIAVLPDAMGVSASDGNDDFELALQSPAYTALRSWQEASPPGYNVNVA